ncbi:MAG: heme transport system permease protein [Thermoleophilaceae bacterium]|nr:heme transport system permease protein [Thermoleophilaceae bacterium]
MTATSVLAGAERQVAPVPAARRRPRRARQLLVASGIGILLVVSVLLGAAIGAVHIPVGDVVGTLLWKAGLGDPPPAQSREVLWQIRIPRLALALSIGAGLGLAGALLQGVFRNPLADPGIIGVSAGAAVGASVAIVSGAELISMAGLGTVTLAAFTTGVATVFLVYGFARHEGRTEIVTLVLTGIAINAMALGVLGLMTFLADDEELRTLSFWTLGSLAGATWPGVMFAGPAAIACCLAAPWLARGLDTLALGELEAEHLGVRVERLRVIAVAMAALITSAAVAVAGMIGFVGLVVPHLVRLAAGPGHRFLLPASALGGAAITALADLASRTLALPQEVPLGVVTALVGGPFFLWLLHRTRSEHGGWR